VQRPLRVRMPRQSLRHQDGLSDAAAWLRQRSAGYLRYAETALADRSFFAGEEFSVADVVAFPIVSTLQPDWGHLPALAKWFERVEARPAVRRGMNILREA